MEPEVGSVPVSFKLNIKNTVEPQRVEPYIVPAFRGQTLLEALKAYQITKTDFKFEIKNLPTSGPYVVSVMGEKNGPDTFWETLLYDPSTKTVEPINLSYNFRNGDAIYLRFALL